MDQQCNNAVFSYFEYAGMDARFVAKSPDEYFNPILPGFYPDPSICRKGSDFFLALSSFAYYPGVPIFHSKDLIHWEPLGHVLNRPSQLNLDGIRLNGGIYAPAIAYNPHNDTFYLITTCVDGIGNFIVKTKDPFEQDWSETIPLPQVGGIDPSLFFDDDGSAFIVHNDEPEGTPQWAGHRAIWIHAFDTATDTTFGERTVLLDGGVDRSKKPVWIEGPHLYKRGGAYFLMAAEGGTSENHSEVILRADAVKGPYTPFAGNPILTQRDLPEIRADRVTCTGHADLIETPEGEWYAVFLGCRPYEGNFYNTGRETFLLPVRWREGFPVILESGVPAPARVKKPRLPAAVGAHTAGAGNFHWRDDFSSKRLGSAWSMLRTPRGEPWFRLDNGLVLRVTEKSIDALDNPAFLGRRQQHTCFEAETEMRYTPKDEKESAGLVCYQNEANNFVFGKTFHAGTLAVTLTRAAYPRSGAQVGTGEQRTVAYEPVPSGLEQSPVRLKVQGAGALYSFYLSFDGVEHWLPVAENNDGRHLSTESAGGFVGVTIGPYAGRQMPQC
ncbi:MAG: glycoside hydrolase family 43 protein [Spirochaetaceae bacterium]|jgi:alpha-N-arabinofuranosidase|nr:glycoside hydrolase family 43 protein [Spirochaetaceae bacterium]